MSNISEELKKAKKIIFSPSQNLKMQPSVVLLIFDEKGVAKKVTEFIYQNGSDYKLVIIQNENCINLSIIERHKNEIFNVDNLEYNSSELKMFQDIQPKIGKFVFGTGFFERNEPIFLVDEIQPKFSLFNGYEIE